MSYGVSITQDGTVLQTAGKYVDQDIVVGMSDSIKLPAQTFNPSTVDQAIPAGKYLSGAQTIKAVSGTKNITENGTYDVTQFASAKVDVPQAMPIEVSTDAEMSAVLTAANVGKVYKFTGATGTYTNGDLYIVEAS